MPGGEQRGPGAQTVFRQALLGGFGAKDSVLLSFTGASSKQVADQAKAFQSLTLLVAVCEQALFELEAAHMNAPDLVAKIESTHDAAIEAILAMGKASATP